VAAHARQPLDVTPDLRRSREASGVDDATLDDAVAGSHSVTDGVVRIPGADRIRQLLFADVRRMIEPLRVSAAEDADRRERYEAYRARFDAHLAAAGSWANDQLNVPVVDGLTGIGDETHDTLHRLVMDLHRELNRLFANVAVESVDGARVSGLTVSDRALVRAFMKGVNRTAPLKFDHPGLGTTAARYGERLSIQNDLGTTDGHIVVARIDGLTATIMYSDIHQKRVRFFQQTLDAYAIEWQSASDGATGDLKTIVGRYTAPGLVQLEDFLTFFGSQLVFLIDWNRARKQLARVIKKPRAVDVLTWAAETGVGHRAFLQAGGAQVIYTAFDRVAPPRIHYGARLDELIGEDNATAYLKAVLRIASTGLAAGHSMRLIQDEVEAELLAHLKTADRQILDAAADHAMLVSSLAERLRSMFARANVSGSADDIRQTATLAKAWETRADEIVQRVSRVLEPGGRHILTRLLHEADDVADALEEAAFLLTLLPDAADGRGIAALAAVADVVADGAREYVRCLEYAKDVSSARNGPDLDTVLVCVDKISDVEHASDAAERKAKAALVGACTEFRGLQVSFEVIRALEEAADALARCATTVRDYVLDAGWDRR
jgi:uncharacterized protein Yka (UPF0111/DUF47 family)